MLRLAPEFRQPLLIALLLHVVVALLLGVSLGREPEKVSVSLPAAEPVQATAVDAAQVEAELQRLRQEQAQKVADEAARQRRIKEQAAAAERQRKAEERRLAELKQKRQAEERQRREAEQQRQAEAQRLAKLKAEQEALAKQKAAEEARLAELERQRKLEAEKQRQAEQARRQQEAEAALKRQLAAEEQRLAQERSRANLKLKAQYVAEITGRVQRNWLRPTGAPAGLRCTVRVRQLPGGDVVGVSIVESSGNVAFDRSVESAVRKASPLPPPPDPALFEREIDFIFSGE